jgi:AcrR family transcriptional regulator
MLSKGVSRQEQKAATRQALLAAARALIAERGVGGTSARDVAARAGVAVGTVFVHFPTMDALAEALLDEHLERALARAFATLRAAGVVDELVHVAAALYASYDEEPALARQVIASALFRSGAVGDQRMASFQSWVAERLAAASARGEIAPLPTAPAFVAFFSLYFGLLVAGLRGQADREEQRAQLRWSLTRLLGAKEKS